MFFCRTYEGIAEIKLKLEGVLLIILAVHRIGLTHQAGCSLCQVRCSYRLDQYMPKVKAKSHSYSEISVYIFPFISSSSIPISIFPSLSVCDIIKRRSARIISRIPAKATPRTKGSVRYLI